VDGARNLERVQAPMAALPFSQCWATRPCAGLKITYGRYLKIPMLTRCAQVKRAAGLLPCLPDPQEKPFLGDLTKGGVKEHFNIAERLWQRHGPALALAMAEPQPRGTFFESTDKASSQMTAIVMFCFNCARHPLFISLMRLDASFVIQKRAMDSRDAFIQGLVHASRSALLLEPFSKPPKKKKKASLNHDKFVPRLLNSNRSIVGMIVKPPVCVVRF